MGWRGQGGGLAAAWSHLLTNSANTKQAGLGVRVHPWAPRTAGQCLDSLPPCRVGALLPLHQQPPPLLLVTGLCAGQGNPCSRRAQGAWKRVSALPLGSWGCRVAPDPREPGEEWRVSPMRVRVNDRGAPASDITAYTSLVVSLCKAGKRRQKQDACLCP